MSVRYYIDADLLGLAHILAGLRPDVTYPGDPGATVKRQVRPPCPVQDPGTKDEEWLRVVGRRGWAVSRWRDIERLRAQPGPFVYRLTRTGITALLDPPP